MAADSLSILWVAALDSFQNVEDSSFFATSPEFQAILAESKEKFTQIGSLVNQLSLFSDNEIISDIQTSSIRYIMIPYYLGQLEQKRMEDRKTHLNHTKLFLGNFISVCDQFELLSTEERKQAEQETIVRDKREDLIAKARKERDIKQRIEYLMKKKEKIISTRGTEAYEGSDEEEIERELYLAQIKLAVVKTFNDIRMIGQELPMLEHMDALKRGDVEAPPPLQAKKNPQVPITIFRDHKGELQAQVFQPHWIQPTMTIEEQAAIEMQNMVTGGGPASEQQESSEESDPDDDEAYRKKREWDAWCDDNPTGSGNTTGNIS